MRPAPVGAEDETRTRDLFITSELLCQLSYSGKLRATKVSTARRFEPRAMLPHGVSAVLDVVSCRAGPRHPRGGLGVGSRRGIMVALHGFGPFVASPSYGRNCVDFRVMGFSPFAPGTVTDGRASLLSPRTWISGSMLTVLVAGDGIEPSASRL